MALPFEITYTIRDDKGRTSDTTVNVPDTFTLAAYTEFGAKLAKMINDIIGGVVVSAGLCLNANVSDIVINDAPKPLCEVQENVGIKARTAEGRSVYMNIPTYREDLRTSGTDNLDRSKAEFQALENMLLTGIDVAAAGDPPKIVKPTDVGEDEIKSIVYMRESFKPRPRRS